MKFTKGNLALRNHIQNGKRVFLFESEKKGYVKFIAEVELFDRNLISFENTGKIILSNAIDNQAFQKIGVTGQEQVENLSSYNIDYLQQHRLLFNTRNF